ncbi:MAG: hypothetical protein II888_01680 [Clostridia bacterium]|nr:hypothetical protein [Clostridia bacterium]
MWKKIIALLLTLAMAAGSMTFALAETAETPATEPAETQEETAEKAEGTEDEAEGTEDEAAEEENLVPMVVEPDPELVRTMGLAAATAVAYGVDPAEIVYYDHLSVGNTTMMQGNFFTEMWGNATSDADVRALLHGYNLIRWDGDTGVFQADPTVVLSELGLESEDTGDRYYTFVLQDDLYYSDGTKITAWDYAFSFLLTLSPEIATLGAIQERIPGLGAIQGSEAYMNGESNILTGVNVIADNTIMITLDGDYLPFFFEQALLSCIPYPISVIAPGVRVADDGAGVYLTNIDGTVNNRVFTAELLESTLEGENGYRSHPSVVSGPYTLTSWDGTVAEFEKNSYYKGNAAGAQALIEKLSYTLSENDSMAAKLDEHEFDLLNKVTYAPVISEEQEKIAIEGSGLALGNYPRSGLAYLAFACEKPTVSSQAVRQAIAWSMDRDQITANYTGNNGLRVDGYYGIGQWMYGLVMGTSDPPISETDEAAAEFGRTIAQETAAWEALNLEGLTGYGLDLEAAAALLDADGWKIDEATGLRSKNVDGENVTLDLTAIYPEGNVIGQELESALVPNLKEIGIGLTLKAVPMAEMSKWVYAENREMDMVFQAVNFDVVFDPASTFDPNNAASVTRQQDQGLYELAAAMNETQPGDTLGYVQKWLAFEEKFNEALPVIPLYSNVYFDFYTDLLHDYNIAQHATWSEAILGATKVDIPEYEIPMVPAEELAEGETLIGD